MRGQEGEAAAAASSAARGALSGTYNLNGQKLGRKGRDTRDRVLAAAAEIIAEGEEISLSAVARRASLGMTSLYNYFSDLTELVLALLEPVMETAEEAYIGMLRERWPDEALAEHCGLYAQRLHAFWMRHAKLLHLRNNMADAHDHRMMLQRVRATQPVIDLFARQMDGDPEVHDSPAMAMASVLMTGIERSVTVTTDPYMTTLLDDPRPRPPEHYLRPATRLIEMAIRDTRERMRDLRAS